MVNDVSEATKECPFCAERIKAAAVLCRFCGSSLDGAAPRQVVARTIPSATASAHAATPLTTYKAKPHWWICAGPAAALVGIMAVGGLIQLGASGGRNPEGAPAIWIVMGPLSLIPIVGLINGFVALKTWFVEVTPRKICFQGGWLSREISEIPLEKIESVTIQQGMVARLLNCGDVVVTGTGTSIKPFTCVGEPTRLRDVLVAAMAAVRKT
jgi:membrane protein YdbS with pleckstrin-like domain